MSVKPTTRTPRKREKFLAALRAYPNVCAACQTAGFSRDSAYTWRNEDEDFRREWDAAKDIGFEALEDEVLRRAQHGVTEPVFYQGEICGEIQRYSDVLAMFRLKAERPAKYRERQEIAHTGPNGGPLTVEVLNGLSDEALRYLAEHGCQPPGGGVAAPAPEAEAADPAAGAADGAAGE